MSKIDDVTKLARILSGVTLAAIVVLPLAIIAELALTPLTPEALKTTIPVSPDATRGQLIAFVAFNLISPIVLLWTLNEMRKLFRSYAKGEILTDHCAALILRIGKGLLALAATSFLLIPIQTLLLSLANPPGQRSIAIGLNNDIIFFALSGGLIIMIGWAMREASAAATENRSFV